MVVAGGGDWKEGSDMTKGSNKVDDNGKVSFEVNSTRTMKLERWRLESGDWRVLAGKSEKLWLSPNCQIHFRDLP